MSDPKHRQACLLAGLALAGCLGGCELLVDFDRSKIPQPMIANETGAETDNTGGTMTPANTGGTSNADAGDASNPGNDASKDAEVDGTMSSSNRAPVAVNDSYKTPLSWMLSVSENAGVLSNDTDADNDVLTATVVLEPEFGKLALHQDGSFTYFDNGELTLAEGESTTVTFTYRASDDEDSSAPAKVTITVTNEPYDGSVPGDGGSPSDGGMDSSI